jgi:hypothetical protein
MLSLLSPLFLSLKEFLPKEYIKQRGAEKRIFQVLEMHRNTLFPFPSVLICSDEEHPIHGVLSPVHIRFYND